jgi:hypothetical protein
MADAHPLGLIVCMERREECEGEATGRGRGEGTLRNGAGEKVDEKGKERGEERREGDKVFILFKHPCGTIR